MKKKEKGHVIASVEPGSIAEELELEAGDAVISINGTEIEDVFDYHYLANEESLVMLVRKADGEEWELEIEKEFEEDLGIVLENGLMDEYRSCSNKCIFCFIDQMPPGMRETLYFKDDDSRLSFLQGNYVTLTNMKEHDIERILRYHLSPINVSVQTMNPELRCRMLNNRFAGEALKKLDRLYEGGIEMNGQIVLCPGVNDGEELDRTIRELERYVPQMQSLSVVPVGLSRFREGLYPLQPVTKELAEKTIRQIEGWQEHFMEKFGIHFVQASDEFYILAGRGMPEEERYDGYIQLENGVGMVRLLLEEAREALKKLPGDQKRRQVSLGTGKLAAPFLEQILSWIREKYPNTEGKVYAVRNDFFGEMITVSGLVTGQDLIAQLSGQKLGERLLLPENMFRSGEEVFLDDLTRKDAETALQVPVCIVKSSGQALVRAILGLEEETEAVPEYQAYELKERLDG